MTSRLTLQEAASRYGISVRELAFLIRSGAVDADLNESGVCIADAELRRYTEQPEKVIRKHHASYWSRLGPGESPRVQWRLGSLSPTVSFAACSSQ